jgi:hypothetical protein
MFEPDSFNGHHPDRRISSGACLRKPTGKADHLNPFTPGDRLHQELEVMAQWW